jgi:hypothetical protein
MNSNPSGHRAQSLGNPKLAQARLDGALLSAARQGSVDRAREALRAGASPHAQELVCERHWRSALFCAVLKGDEPMTRLLLSAGASALEISEEGETALMACSRARHPQLFSLLWDHGARLDLGQGAAPADELGPSHWAGGAQRELCELMSNCSRCFEVALDRDGARVASFVEGADARAALEELACAADDDPGFEKYAMFKRSNQILASFKERLAMEAEAVSGASNPRPRL